MEREKKAYLSAVLDYGTKKIVAYQISKQNNNQIVKDTFDQIKKEDNSNKKQ